MTLVAGDGDEAFPVHRAMMASSSDYFKAMFTGGSANSASLTRACARLRGAEAGIEQKRVTYCIEKFLDVLPCSRNYFKFMFLAV